MILVINPHAGFRSIEHASEWLAQRRWFGDKGRHIVDIRSQFAVEAMVGLSAVRLEVVEIDFATGEPSRYFLVRDPDDSDADHVEDDDVRAWLLRGFVEDRALPHPTGELRWSTHDELATQVGDIATSSRVFRGEQSNTSVVYADTVMLKLFRKVQPGQNPEVEIGHYLTQNSNFRAFPRLLGSIDLISGGGVTTVVAMQQFVLSKGDAWSWLLAGLDESVFASQSVDEMGKLGRRTAELHAALATGTEAAFAPKRIIHSHAAVLYQEALVELNDTIARLDAHGFPDVESLGASLRSALEDLLLLEGTWRIRIHGDYHLGQVLRTESDDFAILDFEGEPSRPLNERRATASPLRDVAGMLRSFDYAAESARRQHQDVLFDQWRALARRRFVEEYTTTVQASRLLTDGMDVERRRRLTAAFEVYKALYEVRYELGNRPEWLDIPLDGLRRIANAVP